MDPTLQAIVRAAQEDGIDPAFALAVAQRESDFRTNAPSSKTINGLFQMTGQERNQWAPAAGVNPNTQDPYGQAKIWTAYINGQVRPNMTRYLGRDPTNQELYLGHYWGEERASRIISGATHPSMNAGDVFSPYELSINPNLRGSVGSLAQNIQADILRREGNFGGSLNAPAADPSKYIIASDNPAPPPAAPAAAPAESYSATQGAMNVGSDTRPYATAGSNALAGIAQDVEAMEQHGAQEEAAGQQEARQQEAQGEQAFANARMAANYRASSAAQRGTSLPGTEINLSQYGVPVSPITPGSTNTPQAPWQPQQPQQAQQQ